MRVEVLALLSLGIGACAGAELVVGDGPAAGGGKTSSLGFDAPHVIAELESEDVSDDDPSLTEDLLLLCFNSKRDAGMGEEDIWCSKRARSDEPWDAPEPQLELNSEHRETGIALALDGLSLWFSSDREGDSTGLDVYSATRPTRDSAWSEPSRVPELSSQDDDLVSAIDESGKRLMLARRMNRDDDEDEDEDADDYDIFLARRPTPSAAWLTPEPVPELNTDAGESDAFLVGQGFSLIFTRDADIVLAQRARLDAPFDRIEPFEVLNSDDRERDAWSNSAFDYIVFSSDRAGSFRLYESHRQSSP